MNKRRGRTAVTAPRTIRDANRAKKCVVDKRRNSSMLRYPSLKCHRESRFHRPSHVSLTRHADERLGGILFDGQTFAGMYPDEILGAEQELQVLPKRSCVDTRLLARVEEPRKRQLRERGDCYTRIPMLLCRAGEVVIRTESRPTARSRRCRRLGARQFVDVPASHPNAPRNLRPRCRYSRGRRHPPRSQVEAQRYAEQVRLDTEEHVTPLRQRLHKAHLQPLFIAGIPENLRLVRQKIADDFRVDYDNLARHLA